ncbi:MAG: hypothetical protein LC647_03055, partial [Beggiatoa sp.]|nr:hypothetical protein [Beggiatoa sp.]
MSKIPDIAKPDKEIDKVKGEKEGLEKLKPEKEGFEKIKPEKESLEKLTSSAESVGDLRFWQGAKCVIQSNLQRMIGTKPEGFSGREF